MISFGLGKDLTKEFVPYASSTVIYQASRFLTTAGAAKIMGPTDFGVWILLGLVIAYSPLLQLGMANGLNLQVPLYKGRGAEGLIRSTRETAFTSILLISVLSAAVLTVLGLSTFASIRNAMLALAVLLVASHMYTYCHVYLASDRQFVALAGTQSAHGLALVVFVLPFTLFWGLEGFIIGQALATTSIVIAVLLYIRKDIGWRFNGSDIKGQMSVGFPIMATGVMYLLVTTVDRWIIGIFLGVEALGFYGIAVLVFGGLMLLPKNVSQMIYPRMAEAYGSQGDFVTLRTWVWRQSMLACGCVIPAVAFTWLAMPALIEKFLPEYLLGIQAVQIVAIGALFTPMSAGMGNFLNTVGKQHYCLLVQAMALVVNVGLSLYLVRMFGIAGVASATAATFAFYSTTLLIVGTAVFRKGPTASPHGSIRLAPTVYKAVGR